MRRYAIIFAIVSVVAGAFGFVGIAAGWAAIGKILFGLFMILSMVLVVLVVFAALSFDAVKKALK